MRRLLLITSAILALAACNPAKHIPEDQYLLQRNKIIIQDADIKKEDIRKFVRQKPNRRIFGFYRFHLNVYQYANRGRENGIRYWMKNTIGEAPVLYDPIMTQNTNKQFEMYMQRKGYFNAEISSQVQLRNNKAYVHYQIIGNKPYTIRDLTYRITDQYLAGFVYADTTAGLITSGKKYDADLIQEERNRITRELKDKGYHQFSREFIFFNVDSTLSNHQVDIEVMIESPQQSRIERQTESTSQRHKRFIIKNVFVQPDYTPFDTRGVHPDTNSFLAVHREAYYHFLHHEPLRIRPRALTNHILLEPNNFYSISDVELTYNFLSRLRNFRYINLQFNELPSNNLQPVTDTIAYLNAHVELTRSPANSLTLEAEGLNTSGNLGIASNLVFLNRNVFRGAEIFNLRLKGALEVAGESSRREVIQNLPFNTIELGAEASVDFPILLFPVGIDNLSRTARPKSTLLTGINYRQRPDYTRYIYNFSYGFEWSPNTRKRQFLHPLEISTIKVFNDSLLRAKIPDGNPLIMSRFRDHLIAGSKYSYNYSSQQLGRDVDFIYFRGNIEAAGNLLYTLFTNSSKTPNRDNSYTVFNIPFAQYVKGDADFRYYRIFNENNTLVYRIMAGIGIPYGNIDVMPFIKSYYGGGANSIRAWSIYSLGPGSYQDSLNVSFDKYGDIKLEANLEYRFGIYKFWKAAMFIDAGNVWFFKENPQFPGGEFIPRRFYKDIAVGTGLGLRLDFDFFIVRLDAAFPLRNPAVNAGSRWLKRLPGFNDWNFNLGIGYPF